MYVCMYVCMYASLFASASDMPSVVSFVDLKDPEGAIYETLDLDVMVRLSTIFYLPRHLNQGWMILPVVCF